MDKLDVSLAHLESKCANFYDSAEVERVFYPEIEKLLLEVLPGRDRCARLQPRRLRQGLSGRLTVKYFMARVVSGTPAHPLKPQRQDV